MNTMNNVKDFGAVGDGVTKDTAAVQRAIDAGGTVVFPPGTYLCGTLYLKSHGGLRLEAGATLLASPDKKDYNAPDFCVQNFHSEKERADGAHFIVAVEQENVSIEGPGRIDGNRKAFWTPPEEMPGVWPGQPWEWRPSQMLFFCECTNVRIHDVELFNTPYWTCFLHGCEYVQIHAVRVFCHQFTRNGDGLDIDCCRHVTVSDCIISSGDDCIAVRGNSKLLKKARPCENITITNCVMQTGGANGIRLGVGSGNSTDAIRNVTVSNCVMCGCRVGIGINAKYCGRAQMTIENILFENLWINAHLPIYILGSDSLDFPVRDISFRHLRGKEAKSSILIDSSELGEVYDINFSDVQFEWVDGGQPEPGEGPFFHSWPHPCPNGAVYVKNTRDITFDRFRIRWKTENPAWKYGLKAIGAVGLVCRDCDFGKPDFDGNEVSVQ